MAKQTKPRKTIKKELKPKSSVAIGEAMTIISRLKQENRRQNDQLAGLLEENGRLKRELNNAVLSFRYTGV